MGVKFMETIDHAWINASRVDIFRIMRNEEANTYEVRAYTNYFGDKKDRKYLIMSSHATSVEAYEALRRFMTELEKVRLV